ncbi:MAG: hypothetical protein R3B91_15800 [Planctomycetaceae bacterium]
MFLLVWPFRPKRIAQIRPLDRHQDWMDVRAGDEVFIHGNRTFVMGLVSGLRLEWHVVLP